MLATRLVKNAKGLYMAFPETGRFPPDKQKNGAVTMLTAGFLPAGKHQCPARLFHLANGQKIKGKALERGMLRAFRFSNDYISLFKCFTSIITRRITNCLIRKNL
ncbi:MAG: hypothetical protein ACFFD4_13300 [Candidatus Odinarchaeota archaeon]